MTLNILCGPARFSNDIAEGFLIEDGGWQGWNDGVAIRRDETARPLAHGDFDAQGYLDARLVTISGKCRAPSPQKLLYYQHQLTGLFRGDDSQKITVQQDGLELWAPARMTGQVTFVPMSDGVTAQFQIHFWCPSPLKFGETRKFASNIVGFHYGNFLAYPVHTITGNMPTGYQITGPGGGAIIIGAPVVTGHPHTWDANTGLLTIDGAVIYGNTIRADTWFYSPGAQFAQILTPATGSGTLSTAVTDTFI